MSKVNQISGFTLIELIIVIVIISTLLVFSFPLFRNIQLFSEKGGEAADIVRLANSLKKRAVEKNIDFLLHLDKIAGRIWVTHENMDDENKEDAKAKGTDISDGTKIMYVQYAGEAKQDSPEYAIRFRKQGYSDFVFIHIVENENDMTLRIDPFLSQTRIIGGHIDLEDCI